MNSNAKFRSSIIFIFFTALYITLIIYLAYLQIGRRAFLENLGKNQYNVELTIKPPRGIIYDRNLKPLAFNIDALSAFILPKKIKDDQKTLSFLKKYFPEAYERYLTKKNTHFMFVKRRISKQEEELIEKNAVAIELLKEPHRFYPIKETSHIIGITDIDNKGILGLEQHFDTLLSGKPTTYTLLRDARSGHYYFGKETAIEGKNGEDIFLTIDGELQFLVQKELEHTVEEFGAKEGMVLIIDPMNGDIITMNQTPTFDPNQTQALDVSLTKNRIATETYEFGSVIKIFTALAALSEKLTTLDEEYDCQDTKTGYVEGIKINTPFRNGKMAFIDVIAQSNNIGTALAAARLNTKLYTHLRQLGFGQSTKSGIMGEQPGFVNPPQSWSKRSFASLSFGYENRATMLQLARAFAMIVNGGYMIPLRFNQREQIKPLTSYAKLYDDASLSDARAILERTVTHGSAKKAYIEGYTIQGKTGTANLLENGTYNPDKNIFTFCGILQKGEYKRIIITFIKESTSKNIYAGSVTVPLFERIAERVIIHDKKIHKGNACQSYDFH